MDAEGNRQTIWEKLVWPKNIPYWIFWGVTALISFAIFSAVLKFYNEEPYLITAAAGSFLTFMVPAHLIFSSHKLRIVLEPVSSILWMSDEEYDMWFRKTYERMFLFKTKVVWTAIILLPACAYALALTVGSPFKHAVINGMGLVFVLPLLLSGSHAAYILIDLMRALREITSRRPFMPFGTTLYAETSALHGFFLHIGVVVTVSYIALALAVFGSPFRSIPIVVALTALAFYPIALFVWSTTQIHNLMQSAKMGQVAAVNLLSQSSYKDANLASPATIETLDRVSAIQARIQIQKEWPFDIYSLGPLSAALLTAIVQGIVLLKALNLLSL
jgi:hypothetical protein